MALAIASGRYFTAMVGLITAASIPAQVYPVLNHTGLFLPYWPMFAVGIAVYYLMQSHSIQTMWLRPRSATIFLCVLCSGMLIWTWNYQIDALVFAVWFGAVVLCLASLDPGFQRYGLFSNFTLVRFACALAVALGTMSYSLYLLHGRLRFLAAQVCRQIFPSNSIAHDFSVIVLTTLMCFAFYLACERPFVATQRKQR
jgi:peptidoglycan/LPS O-acetylase OafA/YrhL